MLIKWDWGSDIVNAQWLSALSSAQKKTADCRRENSATWTEIKEQEVQHKKLSDTFGWRKCFQLLNISAGLGSTQRLRVWNCHHDERQSGTSAACVCVCVLAWMQVAGLRKKRVFSSYLLRIEPGWVMKRSHSPTSKCNFFGKST